MVIFFGNHGYFVLKPYADRKFVHRIVAEVRKMKKRFFCLLVLTVLLAPAFSQEDKDSDTFCIPDDKDELISGQKDMSTPFHFLLGLDLNTIFLSTNIRNGMNFRLPAFRHLHSVRSGNFPFSAI